MLIRRLLSSRGNLVNHHFKMTTPFIIAISGIYVLAVETLSIIVYWSQSL